jgi:cytochrome c-type biogenesis protein CcmH
MLIRCLLFLTLLLAAPFTAWAVQPDEMLVDPKLEARARAISAELRCMVCQNESIDESHAALARDLRLLVRERLLAGDSDDQVRAFLVQRYGDFILLKPPFKPTTLLLWAAPVLILLAGGTAIVLAVRRRRMSPGVAGAGVLDESERKRLESLLKDDAP